MAAEAASPEGPSLVLHSSWTGIVLTVAGAILLCIFTVLLVLGGALWWIIAVAAVLTAISLGVVCFDLPVASEFTSAGVTRRAPLRHQHLAWSDVRRLTRHRSGLARNRSEQAGGGLVAEIGRRRYALVDRMESAIEFDELRRVLGEHGERLGVDQMARPADGRSPTWMYRRSHWRPGR
ncbi:MAG: hypothetical protein AAGD18_25325 [Actinomycetota bacterium]